MPLTPEQGMFYEMLGSCCDSARIAGVPVRLELEDGQIVDGVPTEQAVDAAAPEFDGTGVRLVLWIDQVPVIVGDIRAYAVRRPPDRVISPRSAG